MNLGDLLSALANQELKSLPVTNDADDQSNDSAGFSIETLHARGIIDSINIGLTDLHTKFNLKSKELILRTHPTITMYTLSEEFADSYKGNNPGFTRYINDPIEQFQDDIIKILKVYNERGQYLPINDKNDPTSVFTGSYNKLQIRNPNGGLYSVIYQAKHKQLTNIIKTDDGAGKLDTSQKIDLPHYLEEPLRLFVAHKVLTSTNSSEQINKSIQLLNNYTLLLDELRRNGTLTTTVGYEDQRFLMSDFP